MRIFGPLYDRVLEWSRHRFAERYLAALSFAESSFFPIPVDVMLAPMCLADRPKAWRFAAVATVFGSLCGNPRDIDRTDGVRITFENEEVVHLRPSGNAPQMRAYAVATTSCNIGEAPLLLCSLEPLLCLVASEGSALLCGPFFSCLFLYFGKFRQPGVLDLDQLSHQLIFADTECR